MKKVVYDSIPTSHGTIIDTRIEIGPPTKDGKIFPELTAWERDASPEEIEKLKKEQHAKQKNQGSEQ